MTEHESIANAAATTSARIRSIDLLRGVVIVLMAIDHIRDMFALTAQFPEDMQQLQPGWFFTRWITHFCAPVFVFLAGTSAFLYGQKTQDKSALSRFLLIRGVWLLLVEIVLVNMGWTFAWPLAAGFVFVQVIWVIGWAMILLAALIWLPDWLIAVGSVAVIALHNLADAMDPAALGSWSWLWKLLHVGQSWIPLNDEQSFGVIVIYPLIPWIAVMSAGYAFGRVMLWDERRRTRFLMVSGLAVTLLFVVLRYANIYGDPGPWNSGPNAIDTLMSFLNTGKYPPSLLFLAMTLGPALLALVPLEKMQGVFSEILVVFGRVPFFFYVMHFPLLTALAMGWHKLKYDRWMILLTMRREDLPPDYAAELWLVYVTWALFLIPMYFLCRWYGVYKATHSHFWLKYF